MAQRTPPAWRRPACIAALALVAGMAPTARADDRMLDFDDLGYGFLGATDSFDYRGVRLTAASGLDDGKPGDLVGAIFDGNDPSMCQRLSCPVDNFTPGYYAGLNDGALLLNPIQSGGLHVKSFDASFIGAFQRDGNQALYPLLAGLLEVRGYSADGSYQLERFALTGPIDFHMSHFDTSAGFAAQAFANVAFFAYSCDLTGLCSAFQDNSGQFALDNLALSISPVPEPSSWLMLLGGLGVLGALGQRRRRSV